MMNEKQVEAALKLALEALEKLRMSSWAELKAAFEYADLAIPCIREALADSALERMAENARELGLDYEPAPVAKPHEQQEPVAVVSGYYGGQCVVLPTNPAMLFNSGTAFYTSPPASKPLTDEQRKAIVVCFTSGKVSVSEVQRKLAISYNEAQQLCQSIVDLKLAQGLQLAPSLDRHGIKGDA